MYCVDQERPPLVVLLVGERYEFLHWHLAETFEDEVLIPSTAEEVINNLFFSSGLQRMNSE